MRGANVKILDAEQGTFSPLDGVQGGAGAIGNSGGENGVHPFGLSKKMTAGSGSGDQIRVFLHPR